MKRIITTIITAIMVILTSGCVLNLLDSSGDPGRDTSLGGKYAVLNMLIQSEVQGAKPPSDTTWNDYWKAAFNRWKNNAKDYQKLVDYVISRRKSAGLKDIK